MPIALTRAVSPALARCELTFLARQAIDPERAGAQHGSYCAQLRDLGYEVRTLPALPEAPDCCFVEDTAVVLDEAALLTHQGAASRRGEAAAIAEALRPLRPLQEMAPPATLDGGDVLHIGRTFYVGQSSRTNREGIEALGAFAGAHGHRVEVVTTRGCLHLKSAVTALDDRSVIVNEDWIDADVFRGAGLAVVRTPDQEPWAANVLRAGSAVLVHAGFAVTIRRLQDRGHDVRTVDVSELQKAEGGLTCLSLLLAP